MASDAPTLGSKRSTAAFRKWLAKGGATLADPTSPYELIRFRCPAGLGLIYLNGRGAVTSMTDVAREAWDAFATGEPFPFPEVEAQAVLRIHEVSSDPAALGAMMSLSAGVTIADVMQAVPCTMSAALKMLGIAQAAGMLCRGGGQDRPPLRWSPPQSTNSEAA
ncbi:hypothetical protein MKK64_17290 [Methylobacterium sp. E-025]|uniref:hypothetical protein n=1 Tax=Methylobacterium sp. E-025 TaxID=2836561 RepID=UPI001FBA68D6|nr:hypothetical protein [Methylobacterium sp. E-025]MCJ2112938.1 hypothetical protein [Methylobacterium sp. E-025]